MFFIVLFDAYNILNRLCLDKAPNSAAKELSDLLWLNIKGRHLLERPFPEFIWHRI
jgi:hypothetical protein